MSLLLAVALAGLAGLACMGATGTPQGDAVVSGVVTVVDSLEMAIAGPVSDPQAEHSVAVTLQLVFNAAGPCSFVAVPTNCVLTSVETGSERVRVLGSAEGYRVVADAQGEYRVTLNYRAPVVERDGTYRLDLMLPRNLRNRVQLDIQEAGLEIESDTAVVFRTQPLDAGSRAEAVFGPVTTGSFTWRPRARRTGQEETVFFAEINTVAGVQPGLIELLHLVRCQIAQGELKELRFRAPAGMNVTAVRFPGMATWSFNAEDGVLEVLLAQPVTGELVGAVTTQVACEGLPYRAGLGVVRVEGAAQQRGSLAIVAGAATHVTVDGVVGLEAMNVEDFSAEALAAAGCDGAAPERTETVRRAFRYSAPGDASLQVVAEPVLPEVRVVESSALSISDERIVQSVRLELAVAKTGIFAVRLVVPEGYEVETLSGPDVSHWTELDAHDGAVAAPVVEGGGPDEGRAVAVYFKRRVEDATEINLVMARVEKGVSERIPVPRVRVADARKHTGTLTISAERGVRLMVESQQGVDLEQEGGEAVKMPGVLVFTLLRPDWRVVLGATVLEPVVKARTLQWVDLAEGMLQCRAYVKYRVENAGAKTFLLQAPAPGITLSVTGRGIAHVEESDPEHGIWRVDLHGKVDAFALAVSYQVPYDPAGRRVTILPLLAVGAESEPGYVAVTCAGRLEVGAVGEAAGLKHEDPRSLPRDFGAGDLSDAILCFRTVRPDYALPLSVVRHESAGVLNAIVKRVRMSSVVSPTGRLLTRVMVQMAVGDMRYLRMGLPNADDTLWTVLVNGSEVAPSRDGGFYCIPLEEHGGEETTDVDFIYAGARRNGWLPCRREFRAPVFDGLPLSDVEWVLYVAPGLRYYGFGGSMTRVDEARTATGGFSSDRYEEWNRRQRDENIDKARSVMETAEGYARAGHRKQARQAYQSALNYSQGEEGLNEDARVQLRSLVKEQVKIGLVNRRDALRVSNNIQDQSQAGDLREFRDGDYTPDYARAVEDRLTQKDNQTLDLVADRMIEQQAAAAGVVTAIRVTMPESGRRLRFARALQIDPEGELSIRFCVGSGRTARVLGDTWGVALLFIGCLVGCAALRRR